MNDRLRIASILLGHLITGDQGKDLRARLPQVQHCIGLADLLIGLCETSSPAGAKARAGNDVDVKDSSVRRHDFPLPIVPPMAKQVYERRNARLQPNRSGKRPAVH